MTSKVEISPAFLLISPNPNFKPPLKSLPFKLNPLNQKTVLIRWRNPQTKLTLTRCSNEDGGGGKRWESWVRVGGFSPEKILNAISTATSSPICQFIDSPKTFLHSLDPRIKLVWMDQLGRVAFLSGILFIMLGFGSDGVPSIVQLRTPPPSMIGLPSLPSSLGGYSYTVMKIGPLQLTRKGLSLASTSTCLSFTIFQSASLCLATTTPEQLASALRWFMAPLVLVGAPVAETIFTLLLSLRFINLVFDEVRNAALGIVARRICWQQLTGMETIDVFFMYIRRIFKNIFSHAEQISKAMIARGFLGDSNAHKIYLFSEPTLGVIDVVSLLCLLGVVGAAVLSELVLV